MDDLAILKGGGRRLCQLALARLCLDERITVEESRWGNKKLVRVPNAVAPSEPEMDRGLFSHISSGPPSLDSLMGVVNQWRTIRDQKLQTSGLRRRQNFVVVTFKVGVAMCAWAAWGVAAAIWLGNIVHRFPDDLFPLEVALWVSSVATLVFPFCFRTQAGNTLAGRKVITEAGEQWGVNADPSLVGERDRILRSVVMNGSTAFDKLPSEQYGDVFFFGSRLQSVRIRLRLKRSRRGVRRLWWLRRLWRMRWLWRVRRMWIMQ